MWIARPPGEEPKEFTFHLIDMAEKTSEWSIYGFDEQWSGRCFVIIVNAVHTSHALVHIRLTCGAVGRSASSSHHAGPQPNAQGGLSRVAAEVCLQCFPAGTSVSHVARAPQVNINAGRSPRFGPMALFGPGVRLAMKPPWPCPVHLPETRESGFK